MLQKICSDCFSRWRRGSLSFSKHCDWFLSRQSQLSNILFHWMDCTSPLQADWLSGCYAILSWLAGSYLGDLGAMSCYTGFSSHEGFKSFYQFLTRNFRLLKQMTFVFGVACHYEGKRKVFWVLWMSHHVANWSDREKHFLFSLLCQLIRHFHPVNGHGKRNFLRGVYANFF